jgi:hypothetical protein
VAITSALLVYNGSFAQKQFDIKGSMKGKTSGSVKLAVYHEDDRTQKDFNNDLIPGSFDVKLKEIYGV